MINTVALMGRLTADPELKHTSNGIAVVSFCIAVNRKFKDQQADFINCVAWRQTAEFICKYFHKGQMIGLEGSIQTRNYTDQDGNKRSATEVLAENASFCESKKTKPIRSLLPPLLRPLRPLRAIPAGPARILKKSHWMMTCRFKRGVVCWPVQ